MTTNVALAPPTSNAVSLRAVQDESAWLTWLRDHTDVNWRPGQWDPKLWLFTCSPDDPTTLAGTCAVTNCSVIILHGTLCQACSKARKLSGFGVDEFVQRCRRPNPRLTKAQRSNPWMFLSPRAVDILYGSRRSDLDFRKKRNMGTVLSPFWRTANGG
jgi:hypothetical protein